MTTPTQISPRHKQRGAALIILGLILVLGLITLFTFNLERKQPELEAERKTALALAQAKEALLGYAAQDSNRPGSLPCPDKNDDGELVIGVDSTCTESLIARLPWKKLGITDLRDASGERLWYAISPEFREFLTPGDSPLNSTNFGEITIRNITGEIVNNAEALPSTGVIAVVIAPGGVLSRQGAVVTQDRGCTGGGGCASDQICLAPYQSVAKCNPINYLDVMAGAEDNSNFSPSSANGFVYGLVRDATGRTLVNDRIITITRSEILSVVTFRMARELSLTAYNGTMGNTISSIANKPEIWTDSNWNDAVEDDGATSNVTSNTITLKFKNCNIIYTITGSGIVSRSPAVC